MPKLYEYEVSGFGTFPDDMLRYDQACVVKVRDVPDTKRKVYTLRGKVPPTQGRWKSFLWAANTPRVVKEEEKFPLWQGIPSEDSE